MFFHIDWCIGKSPWSLASSNSTYGLSKTSRASFVLSIIFPTHLIKYFCMDNIHEFWSHAFEDYCTALGISLTYSLPYQHSQKPSLDFATPKTLTFNPDPPTSLPDTKVSKLFHLKSLAKNTPDGFAFGSHIICNLLHGTGNTLPQEQSTNMGGVVIYWSTIYMQTDDRVF